MGELRKVEEDIMNNLNDDGSSSDENMMHDALVLCGFNMVSEAIISSLHTHNDISSSSSSSSSSSRKMGDDIDLLADKIVDDDALRREGDLALSDTVNISSKG